MPTAPAPFWNGNISSMKWKNGNSSQKRGYKFSYDDANRLVQAAYGEGDALTSSTGRFSEVFGYDAHGNVTRLTRHGQVSLVSCVLIDDLTLSYDGNRLSGVSGITGTGI